MILQLEFKFESKENRAAIPQGIQDASGGIERRKMDTVELEMRKFDEDVFVTVMGNAEKEGGKNEGVWENEAEGSIVRVELN
ncbi:hypothetical protein RYX36_036204 [Vicia faba]